MAVPDRNRILFCLGQLVALIKDLGLPQRGAQVSVLFVASTSSYTHESALTSGLYKEYTIMWYCKHAIQFGKALYLCMGSNANSERDPLSKTEAPLMQNRPTEPMH